MFIYLALKIQKKNQHETFQYFNVNVVLVLAFRNKIDTIN